MDPCPEHPIQKGSWTWLMIEADVAPSNFTDAVPPNKSLGSHQEGGWGVGLLKRAGPGREEGGMGRGGEGPAWVGAFISGGSRVSCVGSRQQSRDHQHHSMCWNFPPSDQNELAWPGLALDQGLGNKGTLTD